MIVWTDIESTDLDERSAYLLEVAMIATDDNLVERAATSIIVDPCVNLDEIKMSLVVREMHEKSGLLADIKEGRGLPCKLAEEMLCGWLAKEFLTLEQLRSIPLAGSTIAFDRRWLRHHMPALEKLFLHRSIDVSSINELAQRWSPAVYNDRPKTPKGMAHRALDDIRHSIATLSFYKGRGFVGGLA